ncbi:hypothetical protein AVEN_1201-1 [Araneus ventricosus]|uniref:Uncharacterized protein n=1 Tax=Araneus ventricosus TaxID=182803 RepID=A0A4Y2ND34_ARAVE|nr:hypothetical protein AVEN_1201-1 [Araneus ventricosus]
MRSDLVPYYVGSVNMYSSPAYPKGCKAENRQLEELKSLQIKPRSAAEIKTELGGKTLTRPTHDEEKMMVINARPRLLITLHLLSIVLHFKKSRKENCVSYTLLFVTNRLQRPACSLGI